MNKFAAIILAAGKGKRMNARIVNKVVLPLGNKEMIRHAVDLLESLKIEPVIIVVGFAKKSVMDVLGPRVVFIEQRKRLGTAHALSCGLKKLNQKIEDVLVMNGDDSAFYKKETIEKLVKAHRLSRASITFLTIQVNNPSGLGRIIRDSRGKVKRIIEDKDAGQSEKTIKEINPACFIFDLGFLHKYLGKIKKSKVTGEYYLTSLIDIAIKNNEKIETVRGGKLSWRGINTVRELKEAERLFKMAVE